MQRLIGFSYEFVSELQAVDTRYSDAFKGIIEFTPVVTLSYPLATAVGLVCFISLHFAFILPKNHKREADFIKNTNAGTPFP